MIYLLNAEGVDPEVRNSKESGYSDRVTEGLGVLIQLVLAVEEAIGCCFIENKGGVAAPAVAQCSSCACPTGRGDESRVLLCVTNVDDAGW